MTIKYICNKCGKIMTFQVFEEAVPETIPCDKKGCDGNYILQKR